MFFFPKLVETKKSRFNGEIKVYQQFGKYSISVDNLTQSGGLLVPIWKRGLKVILNSQFPARNATHSVAGGSILNCLILGLGGGTAAQLVAKTWPKAKITAIEIDPVMIALAKKYGFVGNIKIISGDAYKKIYTLHVTRYDLILVDTYCGKSYPNAAKSLKTIKRLKQLLIPNGVIIFNRLNWGEYGQDIEDQIKILKRHFPHVFTKPILSNTLVFCRK